MVHSPRRSSVFGNRKIGDLKDREAPRKAVGNQNLSPGRYDVNEEAKQATQKSLAKAKQNNVKLLHLMLDHQQRMKSQHNHS